MDNKMHFLDFRREVQMMQDNGVFRDDMDAIVYSIQKRQRNETRLRIDRKLQNPEQSSKALLADALFAKDCELTNEDIDFVCESANYGALHEIISSMVVGSQGDMDSEKVLRFLSTLSASDLLKKALDEAEHGSAFSQSTVHLDDLCTLMASHAPEISKESVKEISRIFSGLRKPENVWDGYSTLARNLSLMLRDKSDQTKLISNLASTVQAVPDMICDNTVDLQRAFRCSMSLSKAAQNYTDWSLLKKAEASQAKMAIHMLKALSVKPIQAMGLFGDRLEKADSPIPYYMRMFLSEVIESSLSKHTKQKLCMLSVKVALEAKTKWMFESSIGALIETVKEHLDFKALVGNLNKRGKDNLVECAVTKSDFVHLLGNKHKGSVLESELGL